MGYLPPPLPPQIYAVRPVCAYCGRVEPKCSCGAEDYRHPNERHYLAERGGQRYGVLCSTG